MRLEISQTEAVLFSRYVSWKVILDVEPCDGCETLDQICSMQIPSLCKNAVMSNKARLLFAWRRLF